MPEERVCHEITLVNTAVVVLFKNGTVSSHWDAAFMQGSIMMPTITLVSFLCQFAFTSTYFAHALFLCHRGSRRVEKRSGERSMDCRFHVHFSRALGLIWRRCVIHLPWESFSHAVACVLSPNSIICYGPELGGTQADHVTHCPCDYFFSTMTLLVGSCDP